MQKFYEHKIEDRFDVLENLIHENIIANCDTLANIQLIRYLQVYKELNAEHRAKLELPLE